MEERNSLHIDLIQVKMELTKTREDNTKLVDEMDALQKETMELLAHKQAEALSLRSSMRALQQRFGRSHAASRASRRSAKEAIEVSGYLVRGAIASKPCACGLSCPAGAEFSKSVYTMSYAFSFRRTQTNGVPHTHTLLLRCFCICAGFQLAK